jgi:hypothetical protein
MKRPRIHVKLGRHACLDETLRVLDILVDKQIGDVLKLDNTLSYIHSPNS